MNLTSQQIEQLENALFKKAIGSIEEETTEKAVFDKDSGKYTITEKTTRKKIIPPDTTAGIKLLEMQKNTENTDYSKLSTEDLINKLDELKAEAENILNLEKIGYKTTNKNSWGY